MQRIVDPRQNKLFDAYDPVLTETTRRRLLEGWPGVFRHVILELMPVNVLRGHFSRRMGRPTRELYSMACLDRTRLMGVAIKRFLTQVKRHDPRAYASLDESLRQRYGPSVHQLFGQAAKDIASRRCLRQEVAEDMHRLIRLFANRPDHTKRSSFQAMERIFHEQCDVGGSRPRRSFASGIADVAASKGPTADSNAASGLQRSVPSSPPPHTLAA